MKTQTKENRIEELKSKLTKLEDKYESYNYDYKHEMTYIEEKQRRLEMRMEPLAIELISLEENCSTQEAYRKYHNG